MGLTRRFSHRMREKRFARFRELIANLPKPVRVLDVGGTNEFWKSRGFADSEDFEVTLINQQPEQQLYKNIIPLKGDATDLGQFEDASFGVVFSNSVIEHLFTKENQQAMAREIDRVGRSFWVQTPNYWFPIEPHFHFFGWQWLPLSWRVAIIRRKRCGWRGRTKDPKRARALVEEVRLMTRGELEACFPGARMEPERLMGLTKSWIAIKGF